MFQVYTSGALLPKIIEIGQYLRKLCSNEGSEFTVVRFFFGGGTLYLVYTYIFIIKSYRVQLINEKTHKKSDTCMALHYRHYSNQIQSVGVRIGMYMQFLPVLENKTRTMNTSEHTEMSCHCFTCIRGQHSMVP